MVEIPHDFIYQIYQNPKNHGNIVYMMSCRILIISCIKYLRYVLLTFLRLSITLQVFWKGPHLAQLGGGSPVAPFRGIIGLVYEVPGEPVAHNYGLL